MEAVNLDVGLCFASETQQGPQIQIPLEHLPPRDWVRCYHPQHRQHIRRIWHLATREEVEECIHRLDHCLGCPSCIVGSLYMVCCTEEEEVRKGTAHGQWCQRLQCLEVRGRRCRAYGIVCQGEEMVLFSFLLLLHLPSAYMFLHPFVYFMAWVCTLLCTEGFQD